MAGSRVLMCNYRVLAFRKRGADDDPDYGEGSEADLEQRRVQSQAERHALDHHRYDERCGKGYERGALRRDPDSGEQHEQNHNWYAASVAGNQRHPQVVDVGARWPCDEQRPAGPERRKGIIVRQRLLGINAAVPDPPGRPPVHDPTRRLR